MMSRLIPVLKILLQMIYPPSIIAFSEGAKIYFGVLEKTK